MVDPREKIQIFDAFHAFVQAVLLGQHADWRADLGWLVTTS